MDVYVYFYSNNNSKIPNTSDDLRSLEEMISRRLNHPEWPLPDIFLIDGGRPQIAYLAKIFKERRIARPVIGLSKFGGDKLVFSAGASKAVKQLAENLKPILLLARDEAHRFGNFKLFNVGFGEIFQIIFEFVAVVIKK